MLLGPSIGPKNRLIWSRKNFWISEFFTPKMGKNLILSAHVQEAKRACARCCPAEIFWWVMQNYPMFNIFKIWIVDFPYFGEIPVFLISSQLVIWLWFRPWNKLSLGVLPSFMIPCILRMNKGSFWSFQISN